MGVAQLEQLDERLEKKRKLAQCYLEEFKDCKHCTMLAEPANAKSNYWLNALILNTSTKYSDHSGSSVGAGSSYVSSIVANRNSANQTHKSIRDELLHSLNQQGIMARPVWNLLHTLPFLKDCPHADLPVAIDLQARLINLPSSAKLAEPR